MKDMIPKGTGNSRFLRSVSNFKAIYPTYDDFVNALVAGNLPVDFNGINEAGIQQVGTSLNKANLLTDEVARQVGLRTADPTPNDMFNVLAHVGNLHVWQRVQTYADPVPEIPAGYTLGTAESLVLGEVIKSGASVGYNYSVADSITVSSDGVVSLNTPTTISGYFDGYQSVDGIKGKYVKSEKNSDVWANYFDGIYYIPDTSTVNKKTSYPQNITASIAQLVTGYPYTPAIPAGTTTDYLTSTDMDAYTDGTVDNTTITYLGQLGAASTLCGTYVGTGTNGIGNKTSLTLCVTPKLLLLFNSARFVCIQPNVIGAVGLYLSGETGNVTGVKLTVETSGKTISWYSNTSPAAQFNFAGDKYTYIAIF